MSRSRLIVTSVLGAMVLAVTFGWAQSGSPDDAVIQKLDALEKRIASLEKTITTRLTQIEQSIAKGGTAAPAAPDETEAQAAYAKINQQVAAGDFTGAKKSMDEFQKAYGSTNTARQAQRLAQELEVIGKPAPSEWGIESWYQGEDSIDLTSNKTTLVVFWELWCPHCKREVPKLQALYDGLKGDGLQLVGLTKVTKSATEEGIKEFVKTQNVGYPMAKEDGTLSGYFGVSGIPAAAVVKDGKVIWRGHPARLNEAMIKGWL